jgi:putative hemolysin
MTTPLLELAAILLLVAANGALAGAEIAVVSSREGRLMRRAEEGDRGATAALRLLRSPNRFLATVQVGITAVGIAGGVFGGARLAATLAVGLTGLGVGSEVADSLALALVFVGITGLMLVLGELVPKRIALLDPETLAARAARPMELLSRLAAPLVRLLSVTTAAVVRAFGFHQRQVDSDVEAEIQGMVAQARRAGVLEAAEEEIVDQLFRLSDTTVGRIMIPRDRIVWLDADSSPEAWMSRLGPVRHTRYPVARGTLDRLLGYVTVQELFHRSARGEPLELDPILKEPHRVPPSLPALRLMELFQWSGNHLAVVVDAEGSVLGLVTFHDVMEGIVGDVPEAADVPPPRWVRRSDGSVLADGLLPWTEVLDAFGLSPAGGEPETVQGVLRRLLEGEPQTGAVAESRELRMEIVDMDGRRIDQVLVSERRHPGAPRRRR